MKVRKIMVAALTLGLGATLAACGGSSNTANYEVPEAFDTTQEIKITWYSTMGQNLKDVAQEAIDAFQADYPNVTVDHQTIGGYDDVRNQITTEIPNGNQPNLAYCYADHVALYNKAKAVVQLDNLINDETFGYTEEELNDFVKGYYDEGRNFGDEFMYTLPYSKSTEVLYYNKTVFEAKGWTVPTTWAEMMTLCATIKQEYPNSIPLGLDTEANTFITIAEQLGAEYTSAKGDHFLFDNATNRATVQQLKTWYDAGYFTTKAIINAYTSTLFTLYKSTIPAADYSGSFMSIGSTGGASNQYSSSFECGVAPYPTWNAEAQAKVISQGPNLCIFNKDNAQEVLATWIFVKEYLLDSTFQAKFSMASGYNPVLKSSAVIPAYEEFLNNAVGTSAAGTKALAAKASNDMVEAYYTSPAFVGSSTARDEVGNLMVAVLTGTKDIDKAFKEAIAACEV